MNELSRDLDSQPWFHHTHVHRGLEQAGFLLLVPFPQQPSGWAQCALQGLSCEVMHGKQSESQPKATVAITDGSGIVQL